VSYYCPLGIIDTASNVYLNTVIFSELDSTGMHNTCAKTGHLEHFIIADFIDFGGFGEYPRVGCVDAVDIGIYLTLFCLQHRCNRDCCSIRTTPSKRGDVFIIINTLKARNYHNFAAIEFFVYPLCFDAFYSCLGM